MANEKLVKLSALKAMGEASKAAVDAVKATVPTKVSALTNDSGYQTADDVSTAVSSQIGRVYKPAGTVAFAAIPTPSADVLGNVYNISDEFTTDDRFVDGAGQKIPAGTNVAVVQVGEDYKLDVLAGAVDLTNYVEKETGKGLSTEDYTSAEKTKLSGVAENATKVEASETDGNIKINGTDIPVVSIATDAEVAAAISAVFPTE